MLPLSKDWAPRIAEILDSTEAVVRNNAAPETFSGPQLISVPELRDAWLNLAFALLKRGRQDGDGDFGRWSERLQPLSAADPSWSARWFHEQCLYHLYQADTLHAQEMLQSWPTVSTLPWWEAKKAALLAEIGELEEAKRRAEAAVTAIRLRQQDSPESYELLSQEGWLMVLLSVLDVNEMDQAPEKHDYRGRWAELAAYRADPNPEIEYLQLKLAGLPPEEPAHRTETYDPISSRDSYTYTIFMEPSVSYAIHLPAFALLSLYEEAALPYHCGMVTLHEKEIYRAAEWCAITAPNWSKKAILRSGKREGFDSWLDWIRLGRLSNEELDELYRVASVALRQAQNALASGPPLHRRFAEERLQSFARVISALGLRLSAGQRADALHQLLEAHASAPVRLHPLMLAVTGEAAASLLSRARPDEFLDYVPELLTLPISETWGSEALILGHVDPFAGLPADKLRPLSSSLKPQIDPEAVARLIHVAEQRGASRMIAVRRLAHLYWAGLLDSGQERDFARALWVVTNPETELPANTDLHQTAFLYLPEPDEGVARARIRSYLLEAPIPKYSHAGGRAFGGTAAPVEYFQLWLAVRDKEETSSTQGNPRREAVDLFSKIASWWREEWQAIEGRDLPSADIVDGLQQVSQPMAQVISHVVLPGLEPGDDAVADSAWQLLEEGGARGVPVLRALPAFLLFLPDRAGEIASRIRHGLNSKDDDTVADAAAAVLSWILGTFRSHLPTYPESILRELVNAVVNRREPGYNDVLARVLELAEQVPEGLIPDQIPDICLALDYLLVETRTPDERERLQLLRAGLKQHSGKLLKRRLLAARLAKTLEPIIASNVADCSAVSEWRDAAQADPFSDIRAVFD